MITAHIIGPTFVTVMMNGVTHTINSDHVNYKEVVAALKNRDFDAIEKLIDVATALVNYVSGRVKIENDKVLLDDLEIKNSVVQRILQMLRDGFDAEPMLRFLENLMSNPSKRAVDELYGFLEASKLPITADGCFLAYKKVNDDYMDYYTGTMLNTVGSVLTMPRNAVDDERDRTCSTGLHFCSLSYLPHYHGNQGHVMIVKINPADVVSIPSDYNNAKGRTCRYEVIGEHTGPECEEAFKSPVYDNMMPVYAENNDDETDDVYKSDYDRGYAAGEQTEYWDNASWTAEQWAKSEEWRNGFADGYNERVY
jgi:hypothetical protein